ncbi:serine-rich adhesin for platelets-like isoform X1 [Zingiber officinale]|uniref:serine-rich adhesin for platelets-like isoform X1 n=1 Tax=Zingiber officinale TaxID=94328 RepID=UPI001C4B2067|nr:serine-rich adhesin for platelets-like isoform X1 [Zingiber officinale]
MSSKKNKSMFSKPYLAKSLDWDRDFLTSEGVLDYDELASLNSTFSKIEASSLSVIPESKISTETNSTLCDDDSSALENLEFHLFEKKSASIKTLGTRVRTSGSEKLNKNIPRKGRTRSLELPTKVEVSQYKKKSLVVPGQYGTINHRLQNTSRWVTAVAKAGHEGLTGGKTVSKPTSALPKSNLLTVPAKTICASGSIQIGTRGSKEKSGDVAVQKVVAFKQFNKGSSGSVLKPQASKATSNSTSGSSRWTHNSPPENTRMRCTSQTTSHSSSGSMANKASSSKSNTNQAFSKSSTARTVHTSANNSSTARGLSVELSLPATPSSSCHNVGSVSSAFSKSSTARTVHTSANNSSTARGLSVELSLPATPSSSCHNVGSVSSSSTICPVKSVMNGDEASSSTSSLVAVDANKIHTTNSKSSFDPVNSEDDSCISHISKKSINNHAMATSRKGNNSKNSPGNRTGAKLGKPSGPIVPHSKLANSDLKKPANRNVGTLPQTSPQPKLLKATSQTNKSDAANKAKPTMPQHARPATRNKTMNGHLRTTASSRSSSMESLPFVQFEPSASNGS